MTSRRRRSRKTVNEGTDMKTTRKRGRSDGSPTSSAAAAAAAAAVTPPEAGRGSRKNPTQTSPPEVSPEAPPRKTRRGATTPDTPRRTSPRGCGGSSLGAKESAVVPRGKGQRNRRESTDSSASSVGTISVASSSTPTLRRGRRGSSSSGVSATSENSQVTSPVKRTGRGRKRNQSSSPPSAPLEETNGTSPQYSFRSTKRKKGTAQVETSLPAANGCRSQRTRSRTRLSEVPTPEVLDGGTEDHEASPLSNCENSIPQNSSDSSKATELETPELANSTSCSENAVLEREQEARKFENVENVTDMYENEIKHKKKRYSGKHHKDDIPDSDILHKDITSSVGPDDEKEVSGEHSLISTSVSECENEDHIKLEGTNVPELHSESKHCESHESTDTSILVRDVKNEFSEEHQNTIIPTICEDGHRKIVVTNNSNSETGKHEMQQKSNSPVSKSPGGKVCSVRHESFSSPNSVAGELKDVAKRHPITSNNAECRTRSSDAKCEISALSAVCPSSSSSSRVPSAKRRQISDESIESESQEEKPNAPKKVRLSNSVGDAPDSLADESRGRDSAIAKRKRSGETDESDLDGGKCEGSKKVDMSQRLGCANEVMKTEVKRECPSKAEALLESLNLTQEQTDEVCSVVPAYVRDSSEVRIVEVLVETLLNGSTSVATMNAPRFNKFLRQLLTHYCSLETTKENKHALCEKAVQWARDRKSVNLRHELELTLMSLYYSTCHYKQAEVIATSLYSETKKLQDKEKTVKACLCLSKVYHAMGNISKARANITTAKTEALKIYTPPDMQGELDLQSGIMQVAEGKDMETAYSYFKEAATGFTSHKQRAQALKYMLLSKIMVNRAEEGEKAVRSQSHIQDIDEGVEAMLAISGAANRSSLADFRRIREQYGEHLGGDMVVASVLDDLYITMMEKNLLSIILPYERLQIIHIADCIGLPREEVERRLSQMILDKRINAQLDHRDDCLYVYATEDSDVVYQGGIDILSQLDKTVSHLNRKVKKLL